MTTLEPRNIGSQLDPKAAPKASAQRDLKNGNNPNKRGHEVSEIISFFKTLAIFLVLAFFLRSSVVQAFKIPSGSMQPTLEIDDHILVSKLSYGFLLPFFKKISYPFFQDEMVYQYAIPARGDIVVFTRPDLPDTKEDESDTNIIKRVIGLPGERVRVESMTVYINDVPLKETWSSQWLLSGVQGDFQTEVVPENHVFLLGDNRDHSKDSRFWEDSHFLDIKRIKGRALFIYWSWRQPSRIGTILR